MPLLKFSDIWFGCVGCRNVDISIQNSIRFCRDTAEGWGATWQLELATGDLLLQLRPALGAEGGHAAQHLVEQDAHAPPVHRLPMALACYDLCMQ